MYRDIDLFRKLWRGEPVTLPGGNGESVKVRIYPQPVQKELPAWLTSSGDPETFRMAGELGLNILTHLSGQGIEQLAAIPHGHDDSDRPAHLPLKRFFTRNQRF